MNVTWRQYRELLRSCLGPQKGRVIWLAVLLLGSIALQLVLPLILAAYIDRAQTGSAVRLLLELGLFYIGINIVQQFVNMGQTYVGENVGWAATNKLRTDLARHALRLDMSFHKEHTAGEMIERIDGDVTALANFFSQFVIQLLGNGLLLVGILVVLFWQNPWVGACFTVFALIAIGALLWARNFALPHWAVARQASAEFYGFLGERLTGLEDIRANGAGRYVVRKFFEMLRTLMRTERKAYVRARSMWPMTIVLFAIGQLLVFVLGFYFYKQEILTVGTILLMYTYMDNLRVPLEQVAEQMQDFQKAGASIRRVQQLMATTSQVQDGTRTHVPSGALSVEFDGVTFGYGEESAVLRDMNVKLEAGRTLGIVGRTGSGKTTLTRLLFRLYDLQGGAITLGGTDIRDVPLADLRRRIGIVTQDVRLFRATVRENVTLFDETITDQEVRRVLQEVGLGDWLDSLPEGLDTLLESGGGGLSAGQAQLLSFARVFLGDPGLVILDEASSRLDPATERMVDQALQRLLAGRTAILIAHRLQTLERVDEILLLEKGQVAEQGAREALSHDPTSRYYQLRKTGLEEVLA